MRNCNISTRVVFLFNILTVVVLVIYLVDLEKKIASAKSYDLSKLQYSGELGINDFFQFEYCV